MSEIILHNYAASPVAEKVRKGFGLKGLAWRDVAIPRVPPKPDLVCLTGGYRRTPVMQIGADIYCDSQCILREIERRYPERTFFPAGTEGLGWGASRWSDGELFTLVVKLVLGAAGDALPPDFARDRGRLYLGPDWEGGLEVARAGLAHTAAQLRAHFGWIDDRLACGQPFLTGDRPGLPDLLAWHLVWFVRGRWVEGPMFLSQFEHVVDWEDRMETLGHGEPAPLSAADAIEIARTTPIATPAAGDPHDPQALEPGMAVGVVPDVDGGEEAVQGILQFADRDTVAIRREDPRAGEVCVHFPRAGYRVTVV